MYVHSLKAIQFIPVNIDKAWDFFSDPANLQDITPPETHFRIISHHQGKKIYAGQIIEYTLRPVLNFPVYWMTEITHVDPKTYFVDEQRFGPYRLWHHQHHFKEVDGGIEMTDIVHYKIPFSFLGAFAHWLFVKKKLHGIFTYRFRKVEEIFGSSGRNFQISMK